MSGSTEPVRSTIRMRGASPRKLRVCLAGSGGGHVRQILDLEPAWAPHDYFFVTEDTALGRSLSSAHRTHFVPHYAAGQLRQQGPLAPLWTALRNLIRSAKIVIRERPDVVVSTGAGAVFFTVLWARLLGAHTVVVDSFARFDRPSLFARLAKPFAHDLVVQSAALSAFWPQAKVFDPLRILTEPRPKKEPLLFVTVGATLPFDRMVASVAELKAAGDIPEQVVIQTGEGGLQPPGMSSVETMSFEHIQQLLVRADIVVCHGGTGSLITALRQGCRVIAMPRLSTLGEHYDDHQSEITEAFGARGLIHVARSTEELRDALTACRKQQPTRATTDPDQLIGYLQSIFAAQRKRAGLRPASAGAPSGVPTRSPEP
jgi:UDP-N-acetylglucosamine--N-acetylmuramyl-(pentapeptide) pyrophosphoryl-undecaprenol N-acetylglucosamine transferase